MALGIHPCDNGALMKCSFTCVHFILTLMAHQMKLSNSDSSFNGEINEDVAVPIRPSLWT